MSLRGWMWFVVLWACGVVGAVTLGYAFKIFMNLTLFAVKLVTRPPSRTIDRAAVLSLGRGFGWLQPAPQ